EKSPHRHRRGARADRAPGGVLRYAPAVPQRGLLLGDHLRGDAVPGGHVPGAVRDRADAGMAGAVAGDAARQGAEDRPPASDLYRSRQTGLRADRKKRLTASRKYVARHRQAETSNAGGGPRCGRALTAPVWAAPPGAASAAVA